MANLPLAISGGDYINWGVIHVSVTNLVIIAVMVVVFVLALLLPFPGSGEDER